MLAIEPAYLNAIDPVIEFLQGRNPSLALLLARARISSARPPVCRPKWACCIITRIAGAGSR